MRTTPEEITKEVELWLRQILPTADDSAIRNLATQAAKSPHIQSLEMFGLFLTPLQIAVLALVCGRALSHGLSIEKVSEMSIALVQAMALPKDEELEP